MFTTKTKIGSKINTAKDFRRQIEFNILQKRINKIINN